MWTLTGFADEVDPDFDLQLSTITDLGLRHIEFRSAWGVNVLDLTDAQLATARSAMDAAGVSVSSVGSPIGKILITDDFAPHLDRMRRCTEVADALGSANVRIFSFFIPSGDDPASHRDEVLRRMDALAAIGADAGLQLLHENEKEIYGDIPQRCHDIVTSVDSPALRLVWDNANFVQCGVKPFDEGFELLRPFVHYVHVKDARFADNVVVPAGEGDGQLVETMTGFRDTGFDGYFSLEPHLHFADAMGGFSGADNWRRAHAAFTAMLRSLGIQYN